MEVINKVLKFIHLADVFLQSDIKMREREIKQIKRQILETEYI